MILGRAGIRLSISSLCWRTCRGWQEPPFWRTITASRSAALIMARGAALDARQHQRDGVRRQTYPLRDAGGLAVAGANRTGLPATGPASDEFPVGRRSASEIT
jgi:hypothetical protein